MTMKDDAVNEAIDASVKRLITEMLQSCAPRKDARSPREEVITALRDSIAINDALYRELAK